MKVLVTVSCSKLIEAENEEKAEEIFRKEIGEKLNLKKIHSVVGMEIQGDED